MALIPPGYLKAVYSLGKNVSGEFNHLGTGFLYRHPALEQPDGITTYATFLVTNKHVVDAGASHIRINNYSTGNFEIHSIESVTLDKWFEHPNGADVIVRAVRGSGPLIVGKSKEKPEFFYGDIGSPSEEEAEGIAEGDKIYVMGFPLGLVGETWNYPIVRHGIIARIGNWERENKDTFLIDSSVFPGNSGGPVILQPQSMALPGTKKITLALLIGIATSYIPSQDVAISQQTRRPRVVFEEHSGLSVVASFRIIKQAAEHAMASIISTNFFASHVQTQDPADGEDASGETGTQT